MRPIRISMVNGLFHVTVRCLQQKFYFQQDEDFLEYLKVLERARAKYGFKLHAYCITSNHVHLLLSTPTEDNLSLVMQYINGQYAKNYNRRHGRTGYFWGGRFFSTIIENEKQLLNTILYIELNMVRCGVIKHPKKWKWSSYNQHVKGDGLIQIDFHEIYLELGTTKQERQKKYAAMMDDKMLQKSCLFKQPEFTYGLVYGSETFVQEIIAKYTSHSYYEKRKYYFVVDTNTCCLRKFKKET